MSLFVLGWFGVICFIMVAIPGDINIKVPAKTSIK